jgi:hypothetical protein
MSKPGFWIVSGALLIMAAMLSIPPAFADVNMSEGRWEQTTEFEMEGMPFKMPPTTVTQCVTKQDVVPRSEKDKNCKILSQSIKGNTVTWKVRCEERGSVSEGEGEITYSGASYKGSMSMKMTQEGKTQNAKLKMAGKRIGECTDADRKQKDDLKARVDQAKSTQGEYEAKIRRAQELARLTVPDEGPGACSMSEPDCGNRFGKLNLMEGQWQTVEEGTSTSKDTTPAKTVKGKTKPQEARKEVYTPANEQKSEKCLSEQEALSFTKEASCQSENKRSGDRVTWVSRCTYPDSTVEERGGITYGGNTYEGVKIRKMSTKGTEATFITKLSGRRMGDGSCVAVAPKREFTSKQVPKPEAAEATKDSLNPVKSLKKIFGF